MYDEKTDNAIREFRQMMSRPIFESADAAADLDTIVTPDDDDAEDMERFQEEVDALFGGSAYDTFVPDKYEKVEGAQRDLDDWDIYQINLQDTIEEADFWERIFDRLYGSYGVRQAVKASELRSWFEKNGSEIAEEAFEKYDPEKGELVHGGRYKSEAYWRA